MKTLLLIKEIYREGFRNLGPILIKKYFKIFSWFSFCMFLVVLYAFVYRLFTGFPFDQAIMKTPTSNTSVYLAIAIIGSAIMGLISVLTAITL